jgi:hypothetical protein
MSSAKLTLANLRRKSRANTYSPPSLICKWRKLYHRHMDKAFAGMGRAYGDDARIAELERLIGRLIIEHHLHSTTAPVRLPGGDPRLLLTPRRRLGNARTN